MTPEATVALRTLRMERGNERQLIEVNLFAHLDSAHLGMENNSMNRLTNDSALMILASSSTI
jgi:hypothetical protein